MSSCHSNLIVKSRTISIIYSYRLVRKKLAIIRLILDFILLPIKAIYIMLF